MTEEKRNSLCTNSSLYTIFIRGQKNRNNLDLSKTQAGHYQTPAHVKPEPSLSGMRSVSNAQHKHIQCCHRHKSRQPRDMKAATTE